MIGFLKGELHSIREEDLILLTGGVGYRVAISEASKRGLPAVGSEVELQITTIVREDALHLYGFTTQPEQDFFRLLRSISGIGPKQAIGILSHVDPVAFGHAIAKADIQYLQSVPGIGKKKAEKIVLELREKVSTALLEKPSSGASAAEEGSIQNDLVRALTALGYRRGEIDSIMPKMDLVDESDLSEAIKASLKLLSDN